MSTPETTEAVAIALAAARDVPLVVRSNDGYATTRPASEVELAHAAIEADRKALAEQGYAIVHKDDVAKNDAWIQYMNEQGYELVRRGDVPSWMSDAEGVYVAINRPDNPLIDGKYILVSGVYCIDKPVGEQSHAMIPGTHEWPRTPECRCGAAWGRVNDRCTTEAASEQS